MTATLRTLAVAGLLGMALPAGAQLAVSLPPPEALAAPEPSGSDPEALCRAERSDPQLAAELCRRLGFANAMGALPGSTPVRALWFYDRACTLGAVEGCVAAARLSEQGVRGDPALAGGDAGALTYRKRACELEAKECTAYGQALETGLGVVRGLKSAFGIYLRGCEAGVGRACALAGDLHRRQRGRPLAVTGFYLRACELDDAAGCLAAGRRISSGLGAMVDQAVAQRLQAKACRLDKAVCEARL